MKIGKFAKENNISIDTIRYYMELGIIVPYKKGGQYEFNDNCTNDLHEILQLKEIGFSLQEIKTFLYYKQFVKVENKVSSKYYSAFFQKKIEDTQKTIESLKRNLTILEDRLATYDDKELYSSAKRGIELSSLGIMCCPNCSGDLILQKGMIEDNQVTEGYLVCGCGERYQINDGILIIQKEPEYNNDSITNATNTAEELLFDYIDSTNPIFLDKIYKSLSWYDYKIKREDFACKVVLELGVGLGFFLRTIFDKLANDTIYFAIDYDYNKLKLIKSIIESTDNKKKIVYICTDFKKLPINEGCVDILIDYSGSSDYNFSHKDFLLDNMTRYLKDNSMLYGGYILFDKFGKYNILKQENRKNYMLNCVKEAMDRLSFKLIDETYSEKYYCKETCQYESYQQLGDVIFSYLCVRCFSKI